MLLNISKIHAAPVMAKISFMTMEVTKLSTAMENKVPTPYSNQRGEKSQNWSTSRHKIKGRVPST